MSDNSNVYRELPDNLLNSFNEREVILFVGAGASMGVGLPNWEGLLQRINENLENQLVKQQQDEVQQLFQSAKHNPCDVQELYCKIAEIFKRCDESSYNRIMREIFYPEENGTQKNYRLPEYLKNLSKLPVRGIITTNYDFVLEQALGSSWESFTWQDTDKFHSCLRPSKNFIFHLHGKIDNSDSLIHTCSEYHTLYGRKDKIDDKVGEFSKRLFESNTILFIGYGLGDPIVLQMRESVLKAWGVNPCWYQLIPKPVTKPGEEVTSEIVNHDPCNKDTGMPIKLDYNLADNGSHEISLNKWFATLITQIDEYESKARFSVMVRHTDKNSIPVYGVTQYLKKHQCSYEILDFSGAIGSSRDWIQHQVKLSNAVIVICNSTDSCHTTNAWLTEIKRYYLTQKPIENIVIYNCSQRDDMLSIAEIASSYKELEEFINSVISRISPQESLKCHL